MVVWQRTRKQAVCCSSALVRNKADNFKFTTSSFRYGPDLIPNKQSLKDKEKRLKRIKKLQKCNIFQWGLIIELNRSTQRKNMPNVCGLREDIFLFINIFVSTTTDNCEGEDRGYFSIYLCVSYNWWLWGRRWQSLRVRAIIFFLEPSEVQGPLHSLPTFIWKLTLSHYVMLLPAECKLFFWNQKEKNSSYFPHIFF